MKMQTLSLPEKTRMKVDKALEVNSAIAIEKEIARHIRFSLRILRGRLLAVSRGIHSGAYQASRSLL